MGSPFGPTLSMVYLKKKKTFNNFAKPMCDIIALIGLN